MSANKKQVTAVEWFAEQLGIIGTDTLAKAKAMEKEQIMNAYWEGGQDIPFYEKESEQYYNENYGKE